MGGLALLLGIRAALKAPLAAALGAGAGGAVRYGVMVLFAAAVWPMVFAPLCWKNGYIEGYIEYNGAAPWRILGRVNEV